MFPELTISGYPAEDLWLKRHFLEAAEAAPRGLAAEVAGIAALVGFAEPRPDGLVHNSAALLADGAVQAVYRKILLPNYGVFDERRYFEPGDEPDADRARRRPGRADDLRGHLVPRAARDRRGARRARA